MTDTSSNIQPEKDAAFAELREIGRSEGKGKTARLRAAELVARKAKEGILDETDNQKIWEEIITGAGEEMVDVGGVDLRDSQQFKQRSSDIKHFIVLGKNPNYDGPAVLKQAVERMKHLRATKATKSGRIWELLLSFARAQNERATKPLQEKDIDRVMSDKAKTTGKKELAEKFWAERARLLNLNEGEDIPEVYKCCDILEKVVKDMGGTKKQKAEAREKAKQAKLAKKKADKEPKTTKPTPPIANSGG